MLLSAAAAAQALARGDGAGVTHLAKMRRAPGLLLGDGNGQAGYARRRRRRTSFRGRLGAFTALDALALLLTRAGALVVGTGGYGLVVARRRPGLPRRGLASVGLTGPRSRRAASPETTEAETQGTSTGRTQPSVDTAFPLLGFSLVLFFFLLLLLGFLVGLFPTVFLVRQRQPYGFGHHHVLEVGCIDALLARAGASRRGARARLRATGGFGPLVGGCRAGPGAVFVPRAAATERPGPARAAKDAARRLCPPHHESGMVQRIGGGSAAALLCAGGLELRGPFRANAIRRDNTRRVGR